MICCDKLIHPFQIDPGTSQRQRIISDLLSGTAEIDGRKTADLLNHFYKLSRHINFYDSQMNRSNWQSFFQKSIPFSLAAIIRYDQHAIQKRFGKYNALFGKHPNKQSLQLIIHFIYHQTIFLVNRWHSEMKGSDLPFEKMLEKMIRDKMLEPVKKFIQYTNAAVRTHNIKRIDFGRLQKNPVWNLTSADLEKYAEPVTAATTKRKRMIALRNEMQGLFSGFVNMIALSAAGAGLSMEQSIFPLREELKKNHAPHLALIFAFLKLFKHLQNDLNGFTKKHLDFFYKDVLRFTARKAIPDKTFILFEIQNQLDKYLLKKALAVKNGKDRNKAEIAFTLDDEIVVNKATIAAAKTLFLDHKSVFNPADGKDKTYVEGLFIANDAAKADGESLDFDDKQPKNWPTLGSRSSKYTDPEYKYVKPYASARAAFVLASPVLLMAEGKRTVDIRLACEIRKTFCGDADELFIDRKALPVIQQKLNTDFYYVSQDLIIQAAKKGADSNMIARLRKLLELPPQQLCYLPVPKYRYDVSVPASAFEKDPVTNAGEFTAEELQILSAVFTASKPLRISFSGEKEWIRPKMRQVPDDVSFTLTPHAGNNQNFILNIRATIQADMPAVTFYSKDNLKEDIGTILPVVKIELDPHISIDLKNELGAIYPEFAGTNEMPNDCCLISENKTANHQISLYHFFRNVILTEALDRTSIGVTVCGLKNFVVQSDNSVMNINGPVYPFGPRPDIIDFSLEKTVANCKDDPAFPNPLPNPLPNLIGPNFYVGSSEVFLKKWKSICLKINWKDLPVDFNEYYKAYLKREFPNTGATVLGLNDEDFQVNVAILENGTWIPEKASPKVKKNSITQGLNRLLFSKENCNTGCAADGTFTHAWFIEATDFPGNRGFSDIGKIVTAYKTESREGFIRFNLQNQDFLHHDYALALARQMMAMGKFPDKGVEGAIYYGAGNAVIVFSDTGNKIVGVKTDINDAATLSANASNHIKNAKENADAARAAGTTDITDAEYTDPNLVAGNPSLQASLNSAVADAENAATKAGDANSKVNALQLNLGIFQPNGQLKEELSVPIPNEPWTPVIAGIAIDYTATATITDIGLIHLYAYHGTYKAEQMELAPSLFPAYCDEGTLFVGIDKLVPGMNNNMLFQLAEATADSEAEKTALQWSYLSNNAWKPLRNGFEILEDGTSGLTTSGIVRFAFPAAMTKGNTIMPPDLHWIKVSLRKNSRAVAETIGIHLQAMSATFTNSGNNDELRLNEPLAAGSIAKLREADPSVKTVLQPYDSFGGREPEAEQHFYLRVSETLRHKGRAIQKWDYELLVLEAFPSIYKAKCINHSYALDSKKYINDFPVAPGFVLLAVIPDLTKLKAGNSFEPKAPVSLLENIEEYIRKRTSPFVRLRVMNPRYEKIDICIQVVLVKGKDEVYYREKLQDDIRNFLAPWSVGEFSKLTFGQCINRSDLVRFIEQLDYIDYIMELKMEHENKPMPVVPRQEICPRTPRSILIAGEIDISIIRDDCGDRETYRINPCGNIPEQIHEFCRKPPVIT